MVSVLLKTPVSHQEEPYGCPEPKPVDALSLQSTKLQQLFFIFLFTFDHVIELDVVFLTGNNSIPTLNSITSFLSVFLSEQRLSEAGSASRRRHSEGALD